MSYSSWLPQPLPLLPIWRPREREREGEMSWGLVRERNGAMLGGYLLRRRRYRTK